MVINLTEEDMLLLAKAERYCANEEQCKTSVRKKLCDWGVSVDLSNKIVSKLVEQGFIDERRYARAYCSSKLRHQKWGRLKVIYQLRSKQIPPKFITDALLEIPDEEYRDILRHVADEKWATYSPSDSLAKRKSKLTTFLASRGFEAPEIQNLLKVYTDGETPEEQAV